MLVELDRQLASVGCKVTPCLQRGAAPHGTLDWLCPQLGLCLSGWLVVQLAHLLPDLMLLAAVLYTALLMP